jgi:hypothetical protein
MSCREAFARTVSAFIAASTLGCTAVLEPTSPYILSDTEITTVQRGLFSALPDLDSPNFRSFKAARTTNGDIYVCGWISSKNSKGYPAPSERSSEVYRLVSSFLSALEWINILLQRSSANVVTAV